MPRAFSSSTLAAATASLIMVPATSSTSSSFLPASSALWQGRPTFDTEDGSTSFDWEGTSATFVVSGANSWLTMTANVTADVGKVAVLVNGYAAAELMLHASQTTYLLAAAMGDGPSTVTVWSTLEPGTMNSAPGRDIRILGFTSNGTLSAPSAPLARRMEVIGDSQTADSQFDAESQLCGDWAVTNSELHNWQAHLQRRFAANTSVVAWSGHGLVANCVPNTLPKLPELYRWTEGGTPGALWDFTRQSRPDAVLIHLGQNDFGCNQVNATAFSLAYVAFMQQIVAAFAASPLSDDGAARALARFGTADPAAVPAASTIAFFGAVGPMSTVYGPAVQDAIALATATGLSAHFLDVNGTTLDGCGGHPGAVGHAQMADKAQPQISAVLGW
jgi:hypothetical protein